MRRVHVLAAALALVLLVATTGGLATAGSQGATPALKRERAVQIPTAEPGPPPLPEAAETIQRTFVSTGGSDASPCTRGEPCRTFAAAIARTTEGGEVVALDSGGYGPFTVNKSLTIAGAPGAHVAVTAFSGTAVHVIAGPFDSVTLRNLHVAGLGGGDGIFHQAGTLHVESVVATGFSSFGLISAAVGHSLLITGSRFRHNAAAGVYVTNVGVSTVYLEIADTRADRNGEGFVLFGARGTIVRSAAARNDDHGFRIALASRFALADSISDGNGQDGVHVESTGTKVVLSGMLLSNNVGAGLGATGSGGVASISGSTVTGNGVGLVTAGGGVVESFGDNLVRGNLTGDTLGPILPAGKT